jgi:hypothetical protein
MGGSADGQRVTPPYRYGLSGSRNPLEPRRRFLRFRLAGCGGRARNGMKGRDTVRCSSQLDRENLRKQKPKGVARMKQGGSGYRRNKASRGLENLKAQHSRVRQARCRSLPVSASVVGCQTPWKAARRLCASFSIARTRVQPARVDLCTTGQGHERTVLVIHHWRQSARPKTTRFGTVRSKLEVGASNQYGR